MTNIEILTFLDNNFDEIIARPFDDSTLEISSLSNWDSNSDSEDSLVGPFEYVNNTEDLTTLWSILSENTTYLMDNYVISFS